jgi:predicted dehydrogenase
LKQVLQNIKTGESLVADVPVPAVLPKSVLIKSSKTLISAGTERMAVDFGRAGWLDKARQQPDKVKMAFEKIKTDGLLATVDAISSKLDQPLALGYCNVGAIAECGSGVSEFSIGDRVVSNGPHAEYVCVPKNLCARVPDGVSDDHAVFTVLGAIGLQGVRLANPTIGECFVVTGLGLIGLLTVQILRSHGCRVLGLDFDAARLALAEEFGAETVNLSEGEDPVAAAQRFSRGRGVDAVVITASSNSNEPVSQAATMCRKRGRIVLVGVTGLELSRADFYEKELSFQVSCSYGPGRYDKEYEEQGNDYPVGFVRWTEQRNFEAVLDLMDAGQLDIEALITHRYAIGDAAEAYDTLVSDKSALGIVLDYGSSEVDHAKRTVRLDGAADTTRKMKGAEPVVGVFGAGNYSGRMLMPVLRRNGAHIKSLVSQGGVGAVHYGKKFGVDSVSTDASTVLEDPDVDLVVVATRHDSHADYVLSAIDAGKNIFVEKPLCLTLDELAAIETALGEKPALMMVGFNRRFSPLVVKMKELLATSTGPRTLVMTVNAGSIPADHWTRDPAVGGGRIVGEACHFVDLLRDVADSEIADSSIVSAKSGSAADSALINLEFTDGSIGAIQYLTNGNSRYPKERLEAFVDGKVLRLDNFRRLDGWGWSGFSKQKLWRQDKGQNACIDAVLSAIRNGYKSPIDLQEILEVSRISIELGNASR